MRISDWSSDVCSSDLSLNERRFYIFPQSEHARRHTAACPAVGDACTRSVRSSYGECPWHSPTRSWPPTARFHSAWVRQGLPGTRDRSGPISLPTLPWPRPCRSEEHTSELQSLMRSSYAVFCLKKKK